LKQRAHNLGSPRLWQWPNLLGIDAAIIAVSWFWLLSPKAAPFPFVTATVLALSVWLTYLADRLLDVRKKMAVPPNSLRHYFAHQKQKKLWRIWYFLLLLNIIMALSLLSQTQLLRGSILLLATLGYTLAVQRYKLCHLPKEALVGIIFTAGVILFLDTPPIWPVTLTLFLIFTANCTLIAENEHQEVSAQALTGFHGRSSASPFLLTGAICIAMVTLPLLLSSLAPLAVLYLLREKVNNETFRTLADAFLLNAPLVVFIGRLPL
jgi:hypothetical protein